MNILIGAAIGFAFVPAWIALIVPAWIALTVVAKLVDRSMDANDAQLLAFVVVLLTYVGGLVAWGVS